MMLIKKAEFIKSSTLLKEMPEPRLPEYAFVGRSNVGKSSLINRLCGRKNLAKTSGTPGKTQVVNHFLINERWYLVDLPGYGYAKVSKSKRKDFGDMIVRYLTERKTLLNTFVLVDSRLKPQANDLEFMEFMGAKQLPFTIVFTKIDKLNVTKLEKNIFTYEQTLFHTWESLPPMIATSAVSGIGCNDLLEEIEDINSQFIS